MQRIFLYFSFIASYVCLSAQNTYGQLRWFEVTAGAAYSYPVVKGSSWKYKGRTLPHAGIAVFVPFSDKLSLKSGVLYQMKGMETHASYKPDSIYRLQNFTSRNDYHILSVPLQLAYTFGKHSRDKYRIAAGMNYGFMVKANSKIVVNSYYENNREEVATYNYTHLITAEPKDDIQGLPYHEGTPVNLFTPSARVDFTYQFEEKLLASIYYEYNLQDVRMRAINSSKVYLQAVGISVGIRIW